MSAKEQIRYFHDEETGMELVVSRQSSLSYPLHNHVSVYTFGLVLEGTVRLVRSQGMRICQEYDGFSIPPYMLHGIHAQTPYTLLSLCIDKGFMVYNRMEEVKNHAGRLLKQCWGESGMCQKQIQILLERIDTIYGDISEMAGTAYGKVPGVPCISPESPLEPLRERLETCPERKLSLDEMSRLAFTSKYHLIRTFKRQVGLTPHQFQLQNRVRKAQRLLARQDPRATIAQVALAAGFCDQSHLMKQFEKIVGLTPAAYQMACHKIISGCPHSTPTPAQA